MCFSLFFFCLGAVILRCFSSRHTKWENTWWIEWTLKSIDPSLGLSIKHLGGGHALEEKGKGKGKESVA